VAAAQHNLARCLLAGHGASNPGTAEVQEACSLLEATNKVYTEQLPPSSASALAAQRSLGQCYVLLRRPEAAAPILERTLQLMEELDSDSIQSLGKVHFLLGRVRLLQSRSAESRRHFEWVLQHPDTADALGESERLAAEAFVNWKGDPGGGDCDGHTATAEDVVGSAKLWPWVERGTGERLEEEPSGEPQVEPEVLGGGTAGSSAKGGGSGHLDFPDVDESSLSAVNRAQYLMGSRVRACLGVPPPLASAPCGSAAATSERCCSMVDEETVSLKIVLSRMETECLRLSGAAA